VAVLSRQETGEVLALVRMGVGLSVLWALGSVWSTGVVEAAWLDRADGGLRTLAGGSPWTKLLGGPTPSMVWSLMGVTMVAASALVVGLGGRATALVTAQGFLALQWINTHTGGSYDNLISNALWLLVLSRSTATWSLDCKLRTRRWSSDEHVIAWPRYLLIIQLVVMYTSTGLHKVSLHWLPGGDLSALYYILQQPSWQRWDMTWLAWVYPLTQLATLTTWLWEVTAPLLLLALYYRDTRTRSGWLRQRMNSISWRTRYAQLGLLLHLGTLAALEVGPFSGICLALYVALFHPDEVRALTRRWTSRRTNPGPPIPPGRPSPQGA